MAEEKLYGLAGSLIAVALGAGLLVDDAYDFGKDGFERNPPTPHHYLWGTLLLVGGLAGMGLSTLSILADLK